ncbi:MAG: hypothetical protein DBX55_06755 [Verrucomicrobia bacterium]|nr:MAG: hypothetical protein DBX55_06755 [Verrucomicrobiota bacterium]
MSIATPIFLKTYLKIGVFLKCSILSFKPCDAMQQMKSNAFAKKMCPTNLPDKRALQMSSTNALVKKWGTHRFRIPFLRIPTWVLAWRPRAAADFIVFPFAAAAPQPLKSLFPAA